MQPDEIIEGSDHTFRFAQYGYLVRVTLFAAIIPTMMAYDLAIHGIEVLHQVTPGRRHLPHWVVYGIGLGAGIFVLKTAILPALKYIWRGNVFRTRGDQVMLDGTWIDRADILLVCETMFSGWAIHTTEAKYHIYAFVNPQGLKVFREITSI